MNLIKNSKFSMDFAEFGVDPPITLQENFINYVYSSVDEAISNRLDRLRREDSIISSCKLGCCHCCRYHILTNIAEAHILAQYIKRELSVDEIKKLQLRTQQWHEWESSRPGRYPLINIDEQTDLTKYDHCCPLLVNGTCIAYPVRPVACRTHFVCSPPLSCYSVNNPESTEDAPVVLTSIVTATSPFSMAIRKYIEDSGLDFSRSIMLLPHWLAIEMDWDFAVSL